MRRLALVLVLAPLACSSGTPGPGGGDSGAGLVDHSTTPVPDTGSTPSEARVESGSSKCQTDADCAASPSTPYCALGSGRCVACEQGNLQHACTNATLTCCGTSCVDASSDLKNCGGCGKACALPNADPSCESGGCIVKSCNSGFSDCDQKAENGCEVTGASCACVTGSTGSCYSGPAGTEGVGPCKGGVHTCNDAGTGWGPCTGEVAPQPDRCDNNIDDNCDGILNNGYPSAAGCGCVPKSEQPCYSGPAGTEGKGPCKAGTQTCSDDGVDWGPCQGEVLPQPQDGCLNTIDDDCDGIVNNGFASGAPGCVCTPGSTQSCYEGPAGTLGKGVCKAGTQTCSAAGTGWGGCLGQVVPTLDLCNNGVDEDCDGAADNPPDMDGDGWNVCQGDCCDTPGACGDPKLVNPGAMEVPGNGVDDDCDGQVDNAAPLCDVGLTSNSNNPLDYARAIDLCQFTVENPTNPSDRRWGVISAQLLRADGTGVPATASRSIRPGFGSVITPKKGSSLAVLSTGHAADLTDTSPAYAPFQVNEGQDMGTSSGFPADWLAANGGQLPNAPGCPNIEPGDTANDPVMLKLRIRVPTNAQSFSLNTYFFSAEYPEWVCSPFNDFFVALLDSGFSGTPANPADKNLAFYDPPPDGPPYYPVGVNLAHNNTGLFRQCKNGWASCSWYSPGDELITACQSTAELTGTGFELTPPWGDPLGYGYLGYCDSTDLTGGGTGWLNTKGNVVGGEVIEVRLAIWDTSDHYWDSLVLLDNWTWSVTASKPGTD